MASMKKTTIYCMKKLRRTKVGFISRYDRSFLSYMNKKYKFYKVHFEFFDDYILWLYDLYNSDELRYYYRLEKDLWEYVEFQSGKERDKRGKLDGNWEKD